MAGTADQPPAFYDTDRLRKMSLATSVETSPIRYAIIQSRAPRFKDSSSEVPFGAYNTDTAHKKSLESHCRDNRRFYASSFDSSVPRFNRMAWSASSVDAFYDPTRTKNCKPNSIEKDIEATSIHYAIHRSKYKRFNDKNRTEGPDVVYDVDAGNKQSLYMSVVTSPIRYRNVRSAAEAQFSGRKAVVQQSHLAPGMYEYKYQKDVSVSPALDNRPLSSLISRSPRFGKDKFAGYGLGSTYRPEMDQKAWLSKEVTISKAEYVRPQYLPRTHGNKPATAPARVTRSTD